MRHVRLWISVMVAALPGGCDPESSRAEVVAPSSEVNAGDLLVVAVCPILETLFAFGCI